MSYLVISTYPILILMVAFCTLSSTEKGCTISVSDLSMNQPLLLIPKAKYGYESFYVPNDRDEIIFSENQGLELACPGSLVILGKKVTETELVRVKCNRGKFKLYKKSYIIDSIRCLKIPRHKARYTGHNCLAKYKEIEIGFMIRKRFLRQILVCFNEKHQITLFTEFNMTKTLAYSSAVYQRPQWMQSIFYNLQGNLNKIYKIENHKVTINKLLGLEYTSDKYISRKGNLYLAKGHLAAKTDFLYGPHQSMTFYLINVAPQWQTFNGGNWYRLEDDVRKYANREDVDLRVYTGTHGIATLPHEHTGQDTELYLYVDGKTKLIPVPRLYWKVIYEPSSKKGLAFVGVNNPYVLNKTKDVICKSICKKYKWLTWKSTNIRRGYSYCCSIKDLGKVVLLPDFVANVLTKSGPGYPGKNYSYLLAVFLLVFQILI